MNIDINCDLGEGIGTESLIMPFISSANIACGGHAGDARIIQETILMAKQYHVSVGAHPSYPDRKHFGRIEMTLSENELYNEIYQQIQLIQTIASKEEIQLHHVKPHGALYNTAQKNETVSSVIANAIYDTNPALKVYGLPFSIFEKVCVKKGLQYVREGFADRTYSDDGTLTPRSAPAAMITNTAASVEQVIDIALKQKVKTTSGKWIRMPVNTICIHGDGEHAVVFAKNIHEALEIKKLLINH